MTSGDEAHDLLEQVLQAALRAGTAATGRRGSVVAAGDDITPDGDQADRDQADGNQADRGWAMGDAAALDALAALHDLRERLLAWEPILIEAARARGVSWARLAPALGVTSRQAAERRYLRLRPGGASGLTREQRVQATRDERAGDRAVAAWARDHASKLRQIAGRASAANGLSTAGRRRARALEASLTQDDPGSLIAPLADMHEHLLDDHAGLAAQVDAVGRDVERVRRETQLRRAASDSDSD